jgi:hypothetical protein
MEDYFHDDFQDDLHATSHSTITQLMKKLDELISFSYVELEVSLSAAANPKIMPVTTS